MGSNPGYLLNFFLLLGKEERRSSATPGSQADFLQAIGPQGGRKTRSGSIKVPGGSLLERRGSTRGFTLPC